MLSEVFEWRVLYSGDLWPLKSVRGEMEEDRRHRSPQFMRHKCQDSPSFTSHTWRREKRDGHAVADCRERRH